ncbi:hypothetical protein [Pseudoroseomonas cervicalis]|uniref:hypothetical protein n=1 Tax=Teichococcus cervicalis TaxID=204525 RepID=UPI0027832CAF|nr:hypothetical protein [Pseudoroseomonas cervicalis]MDQ1077963.1 hypothetical protein [Pseudoroseomonas cervicalis]
MPADQVPSDAEVEAMIRRQEARAFNRSEPSVDLGAKEVASMFRALLRERQAVPARIEAAVKAEREACAKVCDALEQFGKGTTGKTALAWSAAAGSLAGQIRGRPEPDGTDHLAAQLAEAEARGLRRAAEAALDEPCTAPQWTEARAAEEALKGRTCRRILALIPTPPADEGKRCSWCDDKGWRWAAGPGERHTVLCDVCQSAGGADDAG